MCRCRTMGSEWQPLPRWQSELFAMAGWERLFAEYPAYGVVVDQCMTGLHRPQPPRLPVKKPSQELLEGNVTAVMNMLRSEHGQLLQSAAQVTCSISTATGLRASGAVTGMELPGGPIAGLNEAALRHWMTHASPRMRRRARTATRIAAST